MTIGANCSISVPCPIRSGSVTHLVQTSSTVTLSETGTGTVWVYFDSSGNLTAGYSLISGAAACNANCKTVNGITAFPPFSLPLYSWAVFAGNFAAAGIDFEAVFSVEAPIAPAAMPPPSGDVTGTYGAQIVSGINGATVPANAPCLGTNSAGQLIAVPVPAVK